MFREVKSRVLAFDIEWVPDPESGKAAYELPQDMPDREVIEFMWEQGGVDGKQVAPMWLEGKLDEIIAYNECDALTTYLLWLRMAHSIGHFDSDQYAEEQRLLRDMIKKDSEGPGRSHLLAYLSKWESLSGAGADE
jgi:predicted PolB exonuclease-like 3'-5' exonuclease